MILRQPTEARKAVRIPLSIEENDLLTKEVLRRRQMGFIEISNEKGKKMAGVPALVNEYVKKGILEMQKEMDEFNRIVLTIDQPVTTDENYFAYIYLQHNSYDQLKNLADWAGYSAMRLAKYMMLKELAKLKEQGERGE